MRVQTGPVKRSYDVSTILEWIVFAPTWLIAGKGLRDTKVNEFDRRRIVKRAKEVLGLDVTMYNAERVNMLQRCEL